MEAALLSGFIKAILPRLFSLVNDKLNLHKGVKGDIDFLIKELRMIVGAIDDDLSVEHGAAAAAAAVSPSNRSLLKVEDGGRASERIHQGHPAEALLPRQRQAQSAQGRQGRHRFPHQGAPHDRRRHRRRPLRRTWRRRRRRRRTDAMHGGPPRARPRHRGLHRRRPVPRRQGAAALFVASPPHGPGNQEVATDKPASGPGVAAAEEDGGGGEPAEAEVHGGGARSTRSGLLIGCGAGG
ncbi:Os11g0225100 [Oryza sativa Japonica Group]|nr:Os11g0225100 [Oryza sativa Japonica Group]